MGILDFLGGGSGADKAAKLKVKATQKYGDPTVRQKALSQLGAMEGPEAVSALLSRFTVTVEPQTTDADEKDHVFDLLRAKGDAAVAPVTDFLKRSDQASSWALRVLTELLSEEQLMNLCVEYLHQLGHEYARDPEKKVVLLQFVSERSDPRIAAELPAFLQDMSDDVKIAALKALGPRKHEPAREPILEVLTHEETAKRVQTAAIAALAQSEFGVQGFREKVEARLKDPYFVDKNGILKKREAAAS